MTYDRFQSCLNVKTFRLHSFFYVSYCIIILIFLDKILSSFVCTWINTGTTFFYIIFTYTSFFYIIRNIIFLNFGILFKTKLRVVLCVYGSLQAFDFFINLSQAKLYYIAGSVRLCVTVNSYVVCQNLH